MRTFVIATGNENKVKEFYRMLSPLGYDVKSIKDLNIEIEAEETGTTFEENSLIKARDIASKLGKEFVVIADDSGLEIKALGGFPGIYSSRFMEGRPYNEKCLEIIKRLEGKEDRTANFTACKRLIDFPTTLINFVEEDKVFVGKTFGKIDTKIEGENGFGYDPIFVSDDLGKSFGLCTLDEKNTVSHRGRALKALLDFIKSN